LIRARRRSLAIFLLYGRAVLRQPGIGPAFTSKQMAESERAKSLKADADRLTELRRFL